ncbi:carboxymuconolactone decarboxylase family protein [Nannocystis punicea]|uniref:Carboxymuconolactone decarboxylase family protein n=1 Tax=Nannocystis punicea TaxID=2995304 RepID=A0ABY7GWM9_9BACT|nr:carboxymuconolactone decarboxylase family protein [Nannocystis poenicansa]WAS91391.1 carboxymuconolactone decarboxylase family protein [Nannocystis poenicansa]
MSDTQPIRLDLLLPDVIKAVMALHREIEALGFDRTIKHLVVTRASQINGCANCLKMHLREAREHGETQDRLDRLIVWEHVSDFTEPEKAALAWTEALTVLDRKTDYGPLRARLRRHFSDQQIAALTAGIGLINLANRMQVSMH